MLLGHLDTRLTIQQLVTGSPQQTASGQPDSVWSDVATVWGSIEPLKGRELLVAQSEGSEIEVRIRIRARTDVTAGMRITAGGRIYDIQSVPPITRNIQRAGLELMCKQGLTDG